jgi:glucose/arabinose dehydrogenase
MSKVINAAIITLLILLLSAGATAPGITGAVNAGPSGLPDPGAHTPAQAWPTITLVEEVGGLDRPLYVTHAHDGSGRLFIVERGGTVRISRDGALNAAPFLDISAKVAIAGGSEQGLLSIAFPPDYADHGYVFVDYTDLDGDVVVARYRVSAAPDVADPDSEHIILAQDQPDPYHYGGQLQFGPHDGYLYIGLGDGGYANDVRDNGQNLATMHGAILRVDVGYPRAAPVVSATTAVYLPLVATAGGLARSYTIPPTNPFTATTGACPEIWVWGLRNPWRFSFDRSSGDLYVGDVGQTQWEEIDVLSPGEGGANLGWSVMEGDHCFQAATCDTAGLTMPVITYPHSEGCAVTGGYVYRGPETALDGIYLYGDYCTGAIWGARQVSGTWESQLLLDSDLFIAGFGEDETGNVYVADLPRGVVYRVTVD